MCTACFLISYLFWLLEMYLLKGEMYLLKGAKCTSSKETGSFTALIVLWRDEMSDVKHEEIRKLGSALIEKKNPKVFQPLLWLLFELCKGT